MDFTQIFSSWRPSAAQLNSDPFTGLRDIVDIAKPAAQPKASATKVDALLKALAGLLEEIETEKDVAAAADGLHDLLDHSRLDLQDVLETSKKARDALAELKKALQGFEPTADDEERNRKIAAALASLDDVYAEQTRRQLEKDWDFLWGLIYLDDRRRRQALHEQDRARSEVAESPCSLPEGVSPSQALQTLSLPGAEVPMPHVLALLDRSENQAGSSRTEKALLVHTGYHQTLRELLAARGSRDFAQRAEQVLAQAEPLSRVLDALRAPADEAPKA